MSWYDDENPTIPMAVGHVRIVSALYLYVIEECIFFFMLVALMCGVYTKCTSFTRMSMLNWNSVVGWRSVLPVQTHIWSQLFRHDTMSRLVQVMSSWGLLYGHIIFSNPQSSANQK